MDKIKCSIFFILRLNKKVIASLIFWTILYSVITSAYTKNSRALQGTWNSFFLNFFCQITLYMWANKLRDIKGVIWELFSKPNMLRWVGLSHQPSLGRFHMTMLLTKGLQWDLPTFKMNMALVCFVTFQAKSDQKPDLIFWNLQV